MVRNKLGIILAVGLLSTLIGCSNQEPEETALIEPVVEQVREEPETGADTEETDDANAELAALERRAEAEGMSVMDYLCNLGDEQYESVTVVEKPEEESLLLINKHYALPEGYVPSDLVGVTSSGENGVVEMRKEAAGQFEKLVTWAASEGFSITACSGYRSAEYQAMLWNNGANSYGTEYADKYWTRPSHSEHQTGLAVDIRINNDTTDLDAVRNYPDEYNKLLANLARFGFILRYPEDKTDITKIEYESWHLRYVGTYAARTIYEDGLCLEEYCARNTLYGITAKG